MKTMNHAIHSTYKILKNKVFNEPIDETWVNWAIEMMRAGYESEHLYILAGEMKPYNQFELQALTDNVLQDLHLDYSNKEDTIRNYTYFLIKSSIHKPETYTYTLRELRDLSINLDYDDEYMDFYLLYWALDDLDYSEYQHYWEGATRANIDDIIKTEFQKFIDKIEQQNT